MFYHLLFAGFAIYGFVQYARAKYVSFLMTLFFLISNGFQLLPLELMEYESTNDWGLFCAVITAVYAYVKGGKNKYLFTPKIRQWLWLFTLFIIAVVIVNYLYIKVPLFDPIVTLRPYLFLLSILFIRNLPVRDIIDVKELLRYITAAQCILFLIQIITYTQILNGFFGGGWIDIGGVSIPRLYNYPMLLPYFLFEEFQSVRAKKSETIGLRILFLITIIMPMHRSLILVVMSLMVLGVLLNQLTIKKVLGYALLGVVLYFTVGSVIKGRFSSSDMKADFEEMFTYNYEDFDLEKNNESTMFYRFALLFERADYILQDPMKSVFGGGLMREKTPMIEALGFKIVYMQDGEKYIISTPDICWPMTLFRLGFVGTFIFLIFIFMLAGYFYKNKDIYVGKTAFLYIMLLLMTSFTGSNLVKIFPLLLPLIDIRIIQSTRSKLITQP